jgi:uncharacterized membrane protein
VAWIAAPIAVDCWHLVGGLGSLLRFRTDNEFIFILVVGLILVALIAAGVEGLPAPVPMVRLLLGLGYILLVPGYALQAALFPRRDDLDGPERLALSFGLSVVVVPPMALLLDALPWGIRTWPIVAVETLFTAGCAGVALWRRGRLAEARFRPEVEFGWRRWWAEQDRAQRRLFALLGVALLLFAVGAAAIIVSPKPGEKLTEFYILGPEGLAENYPRQAVVGQSITVTIGVANHEGVAVEYAIKVFDSVQRIAQAGPLVLQPEETEERSIAFAPVELGEDVKVEFFLYRDGSAEPYRSLWLWLEVTAEGDAS